MVNTKYCIDKGRGSECLTNFIDWQYCVVCLPADIVRRPSDHHIIIACSPASLCPHCARPNWTGKLLTISITGYIDRIIHRYHHTTPHHTTQHHTTPHNTTQQHTIPQTLQHHTTTQHHTRPHHITKPHTTSDITPPYMMIWHHMILGSSMVFIHPDL